MSVLTLASDPQDAAALEGAEAHHARLAGELAGRVKMLLTAVDREPGAAGKIHAGLVTFCDRSLLPHAAAEEAVLYPVAHGMPEARLLIESLIGEHRCLTALVDALHAAPGPAGAAADARALQVLFEEHVAKENGLVLPLLAMTPEVCLAELLADMHHRLASDVPAAGAQGDQNIKEGQDMQEQIEETGGCGGVCACGGTEETAEPELDVREVPHALRHATVFGALDAVPAGTAMVLVAPHDPLPLLAQIEQRSPGTFSVEYLERGPEAWRLRLSHR
ncbi:DUF2249 domain-containing protein [Streptomyces sp. ME08-AFT2]|uniref:DUF2249 domain-containing protein n=1 Tax=Streptomyces TaxID=1883 RepID=UPI000A388EC2|nr:MULTISPECIES: DUF2249 domain-containing protein [Streptomyces]MDX2758847.1 DUF2249 domain-containing protein [Streptomyces europaeiscabiei]MDX3314832.1 DUF2249 domain-containing protein [Streptomyces sp. ME08-AFT2]MDX3632523.1 DUF2249 domain-containing protein [Streptomyces europaeiscabiei]MDX3646806.1 DUF2249 domain-containing protein [Streptomyces europaeiscabiei]